MVYGAAFYPKMINTAPFKVMSDDVFVYTREVLTEEVGDGTIKTAAEKEAGKGMFVAAKETALHKPAEDAAPAVNAEEIQIDDDDEL